LATEKFEMIRAAYLGSFDPITYGHQWVIEEAAKQFDEVIIGIGTNPDKKTMFTAEERFWAIETVVSHLPNVKVEYFVGLFTDFLAEQNVNILLRGLRSGKEYDDQIVMELFAWAQQRTHAPVLPLYVPSPPGKSFISSSLLKAAIREQSPANTLAHPIIVASVLARQNGQYPCFVTGMSGSGKSYVSQKFVEIAKLCGIPCHHIDIDKIAHAAQDTAQEPLYVNMRQNIAREFGADIIIGQGVDGKVDRRKLGPIVFNDPEKMKKLNAIMDEPVAILLRKAMNRKSGILLLDSALAVEAGMLSMSNNNVVVVEAPVELLTARLGARAGLTPEQVKRRSESQLTTEMKLEKIAQTISKDGFGYCDIVTSDSTLSDLRDVFNNMVENIDFLGDLRKIMH
jgi:pantetheine-phosphate adenylyltransferase